MGAHPVNLIFRFLLEIAAIIAMGYWGWKQSDSGMKWIWMILVPLLFMTIWGLFNVPGDPSRSGNAPIAVAGFVRLSIEILFFGFAIWALFQLGLSFYGRLFFALLFIHYLLSYGRVIWLLKQ